MKGLLSVDQFSAGLPAALNRFRTGNTFAFSFGDGVPEAVLLTYDEFEDLGGEAKFEVGETVLEPHQVTAGLPSLLTAIRAGVVPAPLVWGEEGEPEAVILTTAQYRLLRGDDEPPPGVPDDPAERIYATEPLPDSRPFNLDEIANLMGPEAVKDLEALRHDDEPGA